MSRGRIAPVCSLTATVTLLIAICTLPFVASHLTADYSSYGNITGDSSSENLWEIAGVAAAAIAAAFAGVLAWLNGIQIKEGRRSSERQLRAYVGVVESGVTQFAEGQTPVAHIALRNNGQTPAYDFYAAITVALGVYPLPAGAEKMEMPNPLVNLVGGKIKVSQIGVGVVTPTHTTHLSGALGISVSHEAMSDVRAGKRALYVWGFARYRDTFDRYWQLEYRYISGGPGTTDRLYDDQTTEKLGNERDHWALLRLAGEEIDFPTSVKV